MDGLTVFGLCAVTAMLVSYCLEPRSPFYVLVFALACGLGSAYGFLQGAWPFGIVEAIWAGVALRRWKRVRDLSQGGAPGWAAIWRRWPLPTLRSGKPWPECPPE